MHLANVWCTSRGYPQGLRVPSIAASDRLVAPKAHVEVPLFIRIATVTREAATALILRALVLGTV